MPRHTLLACALLTTCGPSAADPTTSAAGSTGTGDPDSTADADPIPPTTDSPAPSSTGTTVPETSTTAHDFISHFDLPPDPCDVWAQNCPQGQKCVPWSSDGGQVWNALKCVDITGTGAPGDPCTAPAGPLAGLDDCALGSICWKVDADNHGTCIGQCTGSPDAPLCPAIHVCNIANDGVLTLCEPWCDPLNPDCPDDRVCFPIEDAFVCALTPPESTGWINEPCTFADECEKGLTCVPSAAASIKCDANAPGCCQPYCDLSAPACPDADQQCLPWYDPMQPIPPGHESLGFCGIPE